MNLFILFGASCSGKSTIVSKLKKMKKEGNTELDHVEFLIPHTTRPPRIGEVDGEDYVFDSEERLEEHKKNNDVIDLRTYNIKVADNDFIKCSYYYLKSDLVDKDPEYTTTYIIVGGCETIIHSKEEFKDCDIFLVEIYLYNYERLKRVILRELNQKNPNFHELYYRILKDEMDEKTILHSDIHIDFSIKSNDINKSTNNIINIISKKIEGN